jgi:hypothetical protein
MSKEVLAAISHTYELSSYAPAELKNLFDDWLTEIEHLITGFVNRKNRVDPDEVAREFTLKRDSVIFIISKLAREGKITMQATTTNKNKIRPLRKPK